MSNTELPAVMLSIAPIFAELLYSGRKLHEFRRVHCRLDVGQRVFLYESRTRRVVTGSFVIDAVLHGGIELAALEPDSEVQEAVRGYLAGARRATAMRPRVLERFAEPRPLSSFGLSRAPQSYQHLAMDQLPANV